MLLIVKEDVAFADSRTRKSEASEQTRVSHRTCSGGTFWERSID